jgi:hypothetical protein
MAKKVNTKLFGNYVINKQVEESLRGEALPRFDYENGDLVIAVMDRGWVFIGFITRLSNERIRLDNAYNIHRWGTTKGLGQLCVEGPQTETVLNEAGTIFGKDIFVMKADLNKWL